MNNKKCIHYNFTTGTRLNPSFYGQMTFDFYIEVKSDEPAYGGKIINFQNMGRKEKENYHLYQQKEVPYTA